MLREIPYAFIIAHMLKIVKLFNIKLTVYVAQEITQALSLLVVRVSSIVFSGRTWLKLKKAGAYVRP